MSVSNISDSFCDSNIWKEMQKSQKGFHENKGLDVFVIIGFTHVEPISANLYRFRNHETVNKSTVF